MLACSRRPPDLLIIRATGVVGASRDVARLRRELLEYPSEDGGLRVFLDLTDFLALRPGVVADQTLLWSRIMDQLERVAVVGGGGVRAWMGDLPLLLRELDVHVGVFRQGNELGAWHWLLTE